MWGAFSPIPNGYPPIPLATFDETTLDDLVVRRDFERMEGAKLWAEKLNISGYIQACATTSVTFWEWIGLEDHFYKRYGMPDMFREALSRESKRVIDEMNKKREEEVAKLKMENGSINRHSTMMGSSNPVDKLLGSK